MFSVKKNKQTSSPHPCILIFACTSFPQISICLKYQVSIQKSVKGKTKWVFLEGHRSIYL